MRPPPPLKRIEELTRELARAAQEHAKGDYVGETLAEMRAEAADPDNFRHGAWVDVASLGGTCSIDAEFRLLSGDSSGWRLLEQSMRYKTWVVLKYPHLCFVKDAVVALFTTTWLHRDEWATPLFALIRNRLRTASAETEQSELSKRQANVASFALALCSPVLNERDEWSERVQGPWAEVLTCLRKGEIRDAFVAACAEHFQIAADVGSEIFRRGSRLLAPELRVMTKICETNGHSVDPSWHPLLALPFYPYQPGGYSESEDPVMELLRRHRDLLDEPPSTEGLIL